MPRKSSGQVIERRWRSSQTYALRFPAYGQRHYITLGTAAEGWTRERAEEELQNVLADVRRALWIPPERGRRHRDAAPASAAPKPEPSFESFAADWLEGRRGEVAPATYQYYAWALRYHLLPYFAHWPLSEIDIQAVDAYRRFKVTQAQERRELARLRAGGEEVPRPLSPASINKTIDILAAVLAVVVEYGRIPANPAAGRRRRLKAPPRRPVHLDTAQQIEALMNAAAQLDREPYWRTSDRRAIIATLIFAGPRAHELCHMLWRDVDLANGRIHIGRSKTQAGLREIPLLPILRDELATYKTRAPRCPDDLVFPTGTGGTRDKDNLRKRVLAGAVERAYQLLNKRDEPPLPIGLTPHKLRHTFAPVLVACGEDPASVMAQLGHTDPKFTLRVYTHVMRRDPAERQRLTALVHGGPLSSRTSPPRRLQSLRTLCRPGGG